MGAVHSRERNSVQFRVTPETIPTIEQFIKAGNFYQLWLVLSGSTREQRRELFRTGNLPRYIHYAISQENEQILRFLVKDCEIPLEERDEQGLTPLYSTLHKGWETGAWILLEGGADVHNADRGLNELDCSFTPILHLAVDTGSKTLVQELVRRGVDVNVKDSGGDDCLYASGFARPKELVEFLSKKMEKTQSSAEDNGCDLFDTKMKKVIDAVSISKDFSLAERLIKKRHSCEQRKMWQVLGAWFAIVGQHERALSCWKKTSIPCWLHDLTVEEEAAPKSAFADIVDVDAHQPLSTVHLSEETKLSMSIRGLHAVERHTSNKQFLTVAVLMVALHFLDEDKIDSAVSLMDRVTDIKILPKRLIAYTIRVLRKALREIKTTPNVSGNVLLKFMATASRCLRLSSTDGPSNALHNAFALESVHCKLCRNVKSLSEVYLEAMNIFCQMQIPSTPQQNLDCRMYTKMFISCLPLSSAQNLFHLLETSATISLLDPSTIKTLVVCSAEVKGQVRQENCLPHLAANADGDTPLHFFAQRLSQEDLLDDGVLDCFLKHGAHLCIRNRRGQSVRDILVERGILSAGELLPSLQCAAAAAFMRDPQLRGKVDQCGVAAVKHFLLDH